MRAMCRISITSGQPHPGARRLCIQPPVDISPHFQATTNPGGIMSAYNVSKVGTLLLVLVIGFVGNSFADDRDEECRNGKCTSSFSAEDSRNECRIGKVPGVYFGNIDSRPIFNSDGEIVDSLNDGRTIVLSGDGTATMVYSAFDTAGNKFNDSGFLVEDFQQPPTVGTWKCVGKDEIRLLIWEYYYYSKHPGDPTFSDLTLKGTIRNTWLLRALDQNYSAWEALDSTLVEIDPPNDPLDPNAPTVFGVHRSNLPTFKRVPNFGNDLNLP